MEGGWGVYSDSVTRKCNEFKKILDDDISDLDKSLTELNKISSEDKLAGNAFKEFKNILHDYNAVINLSKMADEKDKLDCDTYIEKIGDKNYNGDFISKMYNDAERDRDEYRRKASDEWAKANSFNAVVRTILPTGIEIITILPNPYFNNAVSYDHMADLNQATMDEYMAEKVAFDDFNTETSGLFTIGEQYRKLANILLVLMNKNCIKKTYNTPVSDTLLENQEARDAIDKIEKSSFDNQKEIYKAEHPEDADMVDLQSDIFDLRERIANSKNDAERAAMQKELDRLLEKQREEFCKNYYKYDSDGNIIGNNLENWKNNGEEDKIDFYSKVYRSNNRDLWADADSNYEANNLEEKDLVSSIEKLQALKESCKGNSAAQEEIHKQINNLEKQLENNQNGVVRWISNLKEEDENARMNAKEFMDYASSVVLFDSATSSGSDYISRESARNMMEYAWRSMAGDIVKTNGISGNISLWIFTIGVSGNLTTDPKGNISPSISVNGTAGIPLVETPLGATIGLSHSGYFADDLNDVGANTGSLGINGFIPELPFVELGGDLTVSADADSVNDLLFHKTLADPENTYGYSTFIGVTTAPGYDIHGGYSHTFASDKLTINIIDKALDWIYK